jgi:hypothetical protein
LKPSVFSKLHNTFHGENVSIAKLRQQALACDIHPDSAEECIDIFIDSLVYSGLAIRNTDDKIQINSIGVLVEENTILSDENQEDSELPEEQDDQTSVAKSKLLERAKHFEKTKKQGASNINVNIDVDPSMDPEKLEKLLKLLKSYGVI